MQTSKSCYQALFDAYKFNRVTMTRIVTLLNLYVLYNKLLCMCVCVI